MRGWRIAQAPQLWRRYWNECTQLLSLALRDLLPAAWARLRRERQVQQAAEVSACLVQGSAATLTMAGDWWDRDAALLRSALSSLVGRRGSLQIDARGLLSLSPRIHAMLLQCEGAGFALRFTRVRPQRAEMLIKAGCAHWLAH